MVFCNFFLKIVYVVKFRKHKKENKKNTKKKTSYSSSHYSKINIDSVLVSLSRFLNAHIFFILNI